MSSIIFLALQCFECSTMQVKQKKKSSNNWVCVICNQKQSVRKVFAQGYKAKDLRLFVQSFNMSRKVADEEKQTAAADTFSEVEDVGGKKRSDWSEYLDSDPPNERRRLIVEEEEEEEDLKIVTEMPKDTFKRPKLNKYSSAGGSLSAKGDDDTREKDTEQRNLESARVTKATSKWDTWLIDDHVERQAAACFSGREALEDDDGVGEWDRAVTDVSSEYQIVDDEVHPDFM